MSLRVAVAGAGYFAQFHLEAWQRLAGARLVALADPDAKARGAWPLPGYDTLEALLAEQRPDILDLALPPAAHLPAIAAAVAAGVPAVICQKPFCGGIAGARQALDLVRSGATRLIVHENFRFQPWYRAAAQCLAEGRIGSVHQMTFRLRTGDGQGPDAYLARQPYFQTMPRFLLHETGVHLLDVFLYLFGPAEAVYADLRRLNPALRGEDSGMVVVDHCNGVRAVFDGDRHLDHAASDRRVTFGEAWIEGTEGVLRLAGGGGLWLRAFGDTVERPILAAKSWPGFAGDCVHAFQAHALDAVVSGQPAETEAETYLQTLELLELAYRSADRQRKLRVDGQDQ